MIFFPPDVATSRLHIWRCSFASRVGFTSNRFNSKRLEKCHFLGKMTDPQSSVTLRTQNGVYLGCGGALIISYICRSSLASGGFNIGLFKERSVSVRGEVTKPNLAHRRMGVLHNLPSNKGNIVITAA